MKKYYVSAAVLGFLAVLLGAFGAHAMQAQVSARQMEIWDTAVQYQMFHALAILLLGNLADDSRRIWRIAAGCFLTGVLLFSGSLYLLVVTSIKWLGMITPMGGTLFLAGWGLVVVGLIRSEKA